MDPRLETELAKAEAIKRFRTAVRLETSIAADYVIGRHLPVLKERIAREISKGGLPALQTGAASMAKRIADDISKVMEPVLLRALEEDTSDSSKA